MSDLIKQWRVDPGSKVRLGDIDPRSKADAPGDGSKEAGREAADIDEVPKPPSAVDRDVLAAWLGDDDRAINSLLAKFRDTAVAAEREIGAASRAGDLPTLAAAAHKLKGAAQTVGAAGVGTAAATLEQAGKAGDRTRCREGLGPLASELRRALADIDRMNAAAG